MSVMRRTYCEGCWNVLQYDEKKTRPKLCFICENTKDKSIVGLAPTCGSFLIRSEQVAKLVCCCLQFPKRVQSGLPCIYVVQKGRNEFNFDYQPCQNLVRCRLHEALYSTP